MSDDRFKVAVIQALHGQPVPEVLERARLLVRQAVSGGARLVAFPETCLPGYPAWLDACRDAALWDHAPATVVYRRLFEATLLTSG
jgi:nitrilase